MNSEPNSSAETDRAAGTKNSAAQPLVSVIVPVFNAERFLRECLDSVLAQTLREIEVICVNDGSTDASPQILAEYAARDSRVRVTNLENGGVGNARNVGMRAARGEFLSFLDSDDSLPDVRALEELFRNAKVRGVKICGGSVEILDGNGERRRAPRELTFERDELLCFADFQEDYGFYRYIFEREFLVGNGIFFPKYARYQDPPFLARALDAAGTFLALQRASYVYRCDYRELKWSFARVCDLLCGIRDNLKFSRKHGFAKLHCLQILRLFGEFRPHVRPFVRELGRSREKLCSEGGEGVSADGLSPEGAGQGLRSVLREIDALIDIPLARKFKPRLPKFSVADLRKTPLRERLHRVVRLNIRRERVLFRLGKFEVTIPLRKK